MQRLWRRWESRLVTPPDAPPRMRVDDGIRPRVGVYHYGHGWVVAVPEAWPAVVFHEFAHHYDDALLVWASPLGAEIMDVCRTDVWWGRAWERFAHNLSRLALRPEFYRAGHPLHELLQPLLRPW